MAVQVWIGDKPEHPNERRAIVALANGLERLENLYLLLANFNVGGRTIDLVIIKQDAIFIVELKHCDGKLFGGVNGPWYLETANEERRRLNPGRKNPYNQVISYYYSLTNYLNDNRDQILSENKAQQINFRTCRRVVVIAPRIQEGSEIELDWKVELKGLDELPAFLVTERSAEINLSEEEMLAIPDLLGCTRWRDINELIAGVLPTWSEQAAPSAKAVPAPAAAPPAPEPAPTVPVPTLFDQLKQSLQTTAGRLALVLSMLVLVLLGLLLARAGTSTTAVLPPSQNISLSTPIAPPAGGVGVFPNGIETDTSTCTWNGFQSVGKRYDPDAQHWISVGVMGTSVELSPEVIVTLEQVDYCGEQMTLAWSVRNNSTDTVQFPLTDANMQILDTIGNEYAVDASQSEPHTLRVRPDSQEQGVAVVPRPVGQNVPILLVRLKNEPFGEASWLVSLEEN